MQNTDTLIANLEEKGSLSQEGFLFLIEAALENPLVFEELKSLADKIRREYFNNKIYIRGLIEISNYCKNNCYYCGIRADNKSLNRYRLSKEQILESVDTGYELGFRTFVLQGGEDKAYTDKLLCEIIAAIKSKYSDAAITLSLGERGEESFKALYDAGACRYLLREETADKDHYHFLHPEQMSFENRMKSLYLLKKTGFQVGCGFMVGSPGQGLLEIAKDLCFISEFNPHMVGIGPFIPHHATLFCDEAAGDYKLTLALISIIRIMLKKALIPATTALNSISKSGRTDGILHGANVIMPNLGPKDIRKKYEIYDNKNAYGAESKEGLESLKIMIKDIGFEIVTDRGDYPGWKDVQG